MPDDTNKPRSRRKLLQVAALSTTAALAACANDPPVTDAGTDVFSIDAGLSTQDAGADSADVAPTNDVLVGLLPQDAGPSDAVTVDAGISVQDAGTE